MLGKTAISATRSLLFLATQDPHRFWSPRRVAEEIGESPSYLAKVVRHLVMVNILESERGAKGGVRLARPASRIPLLDVVEACQGVIVGDFCRHPNPRHPYCAFHRASAELHEAIRAVLLRWTIADLVNGPSPRPEAPGEPRCLMAGAIRIQACQ